MTAFSVAMTGLAVREVFEAADDLAALVVVDSVFDVALPSG